MQITQAVLEQAEMDAPKSGYDTTQHYMLQKDETGKVEIVTADNTQALASMQTQATDENGVGLVDENGDPIYVGSTASTIYQSPDYNGPIIGDGDGIPPNGAPFTANIAFPTNPSIGQYHLRTDYKPKRLFRFSGTRWIKVEDVNRMTMNNLGYEDVADGGSPDNMFLDKDVRLTQKTSFVNNNAQATINGKVVKQKQSLTKALRPKADE